MAASKTKESASREPRSFLFVPADRPDRYAKALASGADRVIIDLEDAIAATAKAAARAQLAQAFGELDRRERILVRINGRTTGFATDDIALVASLGVGGVVIPKAESADDVQSLRAALGSQALIVAIIESAEGWHALDAIAASDGHLRLAFGNLDFQLDLGMRAGEDEAELAPVRLDIVSASRRFGLPAPIDGVTVDVAADGAVRADTERARRFGFTAKLCIHPAQVASVHRLFAPSAAEIAWAERVLAAARDSSGAAVKLDGKMIDEPVILRARGVLAAASE